jgi:histidinol-phosphate aminotransferase
MSIFEARSNPILKRLRPYTPGPTAAEISARHGIDSDRIVKLSSNEAPLGPSPEVRTAIRTVAEGDDLHRYPSTAVPQLRNAIGERLGVDAAHILPTAGSSQSWPMIVRAFSRVDDRVIWVEPSMTSYGEVAVLAERDEHVVVTVSPFEPPTDDIIAAADDDTRIIFVQSPNNTTSRLTSPADLRRIAAGVPQAVVVVDEHYIEAADDYEAVSAVHLIDDVPNLVVTRSFSRMYGLAGLRVGYVVAPVEAIQTISKFRPNWSVSVVAEAAARAALADQNHLDRNIAMTRQGRSFLDESLRSIDSLDVVPDPQGGFLLFHPRSRDAEAVNDSLVRQGVMVRGDLLDGWIRVSVGTPEQNEIFVDALTTALAER